MLKRLCCTLILPLIKMILVDAFLHKGWMLYNGHADFNVYVWLHIYPEGQCALLRVISKRAHYREDLWSSRGQCPPAQRGSSLAGAAQRGAGMFLRCAETGSPMWLARNVMFNKGCFHSQTKCPRQCVCGCAPTGHRGGGATAALFARRKIVLWLGNSVA